MAYRIKNKKLNILWPITILKFCLPILSFTFFGQIFLLLATIFDCRNGNTFVSENIKCRTGTWFQIFGPLTGLALFFEVVIALMTNMLYFEPIFYNSNSDSLKKTNTLPDTIFALTKISINILFISDKGKENEHWAVLFFLISFTGINAYYNLYYQNRTNTALTKLNNILCLVTFAAYISLFVGKLFKSIGFTGSIYLFFSGFVIIIVFSFLYKKNEINYILVNYAEINNPVDYLYYISTYYKIIQNKDNYRNYSTILKSLISKIEENCIIPDCPLKKYLVNLNRGIENKFLLYQYCDYLFKYGLIRFSDDISLKNNYSIFLITNMNYKKKAIILLNSIKDKQLSFQNNYHVYRTFKLIEKWDFSIVAKDNSIFRFKKKIQDFKSLIKNIIISYYEFMSLLLASKIRNVDNFNKIHKIGLKIMKDNKTIEEIYCKLIKVKTDNLEIIKLYSEFVEEILKDDDKLEKCKNTSKMSYSNGYEISEKDFSNFDINILNEKGNLPYLIISINEDNENKIIDLSLNVCKIFGYTKNELLGQNINFIIPTLFHKKHDLVIKEQYDNHKLKIFDDLNKMKVYLPDFIKMNAYGISKMKFLIELKFEIYFVRTEENKLVYIVEISNYNPIVLDLIKYVNYESNYCVLTDENFIIQSFTANCLEYLKLKYETINSNNNIINYIKQFQDDYLKAINNANVSIYSHANNNSMLSIHSEEKFSDFSNNNIINIQNFAKKKLGNELMNKKYCKKCKIIWKYVKEKNLINFHIEKNNVLIANSEKSVNILRSKTIKQEIDHKSSKTVSNLYKIEEKKSNKSTNSITNPEEELELYMEIKKIIIKNELIGYYFYFTKANENIDNNLSYTTQNYKFKDRNNLTKYKKYQCKFINRDEDIFDMNNNDFSNSFVIKPPNPQDKNDIKKLGKRERRQSLEKRLKVSFKEEEKDFMNNYLFINKNEKKNSEPVIVTEEYIPKFTSHFTINTNDFGFFKVNEEDNIDINFLEVLKKEANSKITEFKKQIKTSKKKSESSSDDSDESEEDSDNYSSSEYSNLSSSSINSSDESKSENLDKNINRNVKEKKENKEKKEKKENNNIITSNNNNNNSTNNALGNKSSKKIHKKGVELENYYSVDLSHIKLMVFDYYKDCVVEGNKKEICSKIQNILNDLKSFELLDSENEERINSITHSVKNLKKYSFHNKRAIKKENDQDTPTTNNIVNNQVDEKKLIERKIFESLNKHKDELPIKRLKIFSSLTYIIIILFTGLMIFFDDLYISYIKQNINILKNIIYIKYFSHISVYFVRELTLLNFNIEEIKGGIYQNIPALFKEEYISLIKEELMEIFIENQNSMKILYSSSLELSKNASKYISEAEIPIKKLNQKTIDIKYDILTALIQYNSEFYNLASSSASIEQNNPDLYNFIYNNLNGYKKGINILMDVYIDELKIYNYELKLIIITCYILLFISFIYIYIYIIINFISAIEIRGTYMEVFYGINENTLKSLISSCENMINKLKSSKEQKYNDIETLYESNDDKMTYNNSIPKQNQSSSNSNLSLSNEYENRSDKKASNYGITYIILYGIFLLISYSYFIYNGFYIINASANSIFTSNVFKKLQHIHLGLIDIFNVYREFLFDNQSIVNEISPFEYLSFVEKEELPKMSIDYKYLISNTEKWLNKTDFFHDTLCGFYINDFFDSTLQCEEYIGLITKYNFIYLSNYFLEEIKINKNLVKYKLKYDKVLGNLTEYNPDDYINNNLIPRAEDAPDDSTLFRLDLFNNETLHFNLNIIFFSIILPYIQSKRKNCFYFINYLEVYLPTISLIFFVFVTGAIFSYFIPIINIINSIIYKTKNMLSIIPLCILSSQKSALSLFNISSNK